MYICLIYNDLIGFLVCCCSLLFAELQRNVWSVVWSVF
nr:MAG TPA: hypothetical protein [Caudoviricetes sp.]